MLAHAGPDAIAFHYVPLHHDSMEVVTCTPVLTRTSSSWHRAYVSNRAFSGAWLAGRGGRRVRVLPPRADLSHGRGHRQGDDPPWPNERAGG